MRNIIDQTHEENRIDFSALDHNRYDQRARQLRSRYVWGLLRQWLKGNDSEKKAADVLDGCPCR